MEIVVERMKTFFVVVQDKEQKLLTYPFLMNLT